MSLLWVSVVLSLLKVGPGHITNTIIHTPHLSSHPVTRSLIVWEAVSAEYLAVRP
jgi:hypothetical protein